MANWYDKLVCKHKWRIENKEMGLLPWKYLRTQEGVVPMPWMFERDVWLLLICNECGETKVVRQSEKAEE